MGATYTAVNIVSTKGHLPPSIYVRVRIVLKIWIPEETVPHIANTKSQKHTISAFRTPISTMQRHSPSNSSLNLREHRKLAATNFFVRTWLFSLNAYLLKPSRNVVVKYML